MEVTATFKYAKTDLVREGYAPRADGDPTYLYDPERAAYLRIDEPLYDRIQAAKLRL
jgi:hypothetical protein